MLTITSAKFVGRDAEFQAFKQLLERRLLFGDPAAPDFLLLSGPPGIGKSRLIQEFKYHALIKETGFFTAVTPDDARTGSPFLEIVRRMVHQTLGPSGGGVGSQTRRLLAATAIPKTLAQLFDKHRSALSAFVPELAPEGKTLEAPRGPAFHKAVLGLLLDTARVIPVIYAVEDLHLADEQTLAILHDLAAAPPEPARRMMMIGSTYGDLSPAHALSPILERLRASNRVMDLRIEGLKAIETAELIRSMLQIDRSAIPLVKRIIEECRGNPLFIEELMKLLIEEKAIYCETTRFKTLVERPEEFRFPGSLAECYVRRLGLLSAEAQRVLSVLAAIRRPIDLNLIAENAGFERARMGEVLVEAERRGFVRKSIEEDRVTYRLRHPAMREAILSTSVQGGKPTWRGERGLREILELSKVLFEEGSLEDLYRRVLEGAAMLAAAERGFLLARVDGEPRVAAIRRFDAEKLLGPAYRDLLDRAKAASQAQRTVLGGEGADLHTSNPEGLGLRSTMFVPLIAGKDALGAICLDNSLAGAPFSEDDLRMVSDFAGQAAFAIRALRRSPAGVREPEPPSRSLESVSLGYVREVLAFTGGNLAQASRILGVPYVTLWRKVKKYQLLVK
ncbi:MAG: AAA family ATPase [Candidatus Brocadiae bacterium]|nr:AAA family ATPase [Candidatus Brocadiia bacterium]